ncbi:hypothetical protein ACFQ9U_11185 [Streptomyces sp. NPDC056568]|uniref:hypothetical protein n=1 Tax=Streptomyces sp. NPDC056568 TaxID=3345866 RepID=UPI0036B72E7A
MADEQDRWLDRATAEILLRGESPEAVDPAVRDRAARLAETLGALAVPPVPTSGELPGEAAALAAFRSARAERADAPEGTPAHPGRDASAAPSDAGLVRIGSRGDGAGRARRSRPLRLGLAAVLTVGMVGGVAVAAGTGVLTTPFEGSGPDPAATVSAATSSDGPPASPSPLDGVQGGAGPGRDGTEGGAGDRDAGSDDRAAAGAGDGRPDLTAACREVRAGEQLEGARGHALKEAAGGASRVAPYCRSLLAQAGTSARDRDGARDGKENGRAREQDPSRNGKGGKGDKGDKSHKGSKSAKSTKADRGGNESSDGKDGKGGKGGKGAKGDRDSREGKGGGKGGKGDDDDRHRTLPPAGHRYAPHAPSAFPPSPQRRPAFPAHAVLTPAEPS